jgi:hypothetical protein
VLALQPGRLRHAESREQGAGVRRAEGVVFPWPENRMLPACTKPGVAAPPGENFVRESAAHVPQVVADVLNT